MGNLTYTDPLTLQNYGSNSATISIIGTVSNAGNSTNSGHFKALAGGETYVSASTTITTYADILINSASYDGTVAATHGISLVGTTLNSNGGAIRLGGGTARDGSGYSTNGNIAYNGIRIATDPSTINSGGGDISIRAQSANNVAMALESGSAALSVNSGSGSITLDVLSGGAAGNPALYLANGGLSLTSTTGAINVTAKGSTTDSGAAVYQTGDGIYSAATYGLSLVSTSGPITLTASGAAGVGGLNLFGPLTLGGASTSGAITVAADRMALGNTAGSNIQTSGALTLKPYGISTSLGLGSGAGTLSLPQSYFWNGTNGVVKAGLSSLTFGRTDGTGLLTLGGALTLNSSATTNLHAGSYIDSGSNILTVNAGSGTLNLAAHATAGNIGASGDSIDFAAGTTTVTTTGNGSAYITSAASYALGASTVGSGTLKVGAGGTATVTQSGAASAGTLVLDASGLTVTLSQAGNDFDTLNGTAGVLTLRDTDGLDVGALTATSFDLTTGGNVTSSGALSTGLLNLNLGSFDATLNYVGSNFTGGVRGTARHLTLRDDSGGISLGGSPLTLSGNLVVTSNGGAITQTGELVIGGTTTLTAGSYDITLTNASNDFTGAVNIVSARDTTLYDTNSLHLGNASVRKLTAIAGTGGGTPGAGDLYLDSGTVITASNNPNATGLQSSVVLVSGKGSSGRFINNAGANAINLTGGNGTRWVVYTNNPYINGDVLGGLTSGSFAVFNTHYPDHNSTTRPSVARGPEHTDVLNGNRYVLSMDLADIPGADPSKVTVTALDVNKTYGDGLALSAGSATSVSFASGNSVISEFSEAAPAWLGVGNLTLTSAGTATTANVGSYGVSIGGDIGINPGSGLVYQTVTPTLSPSGTSTGIYSGACSYGTCQVTLKALGSVIVGQRVLTLTPATTGVAANKTYDGTAAGTWTTAPTFTLGNTANSDVVTLTGTATATFADKNVGTSKTVTLSGFSASSANYALPMLPTYTADITARNITISATGQNKTYDATNVATVTLAPSASAAPGTAGSGFITGDLLTYSYTGAVFDAGKNAGSTLAITVSGLSLGGADAANYTLAAATASTSANIAQRAITLTALSGSKTYDGSAVLSAPTFALDASAILGSDALSGATGNATFNNRHAGNGKTLTADLATLTLTGADAGNYTLGTGSYVGSGNIIARTVTLTQGNVSRPYDGTAAYTLTAGDLSTFTTALGVSGDTVTAGSASFDSKHVGSGNKTLTLDSATVSDGNSGNNYALTLAGNNASTITQAALTVSTGNVIKTYDGTLTAAGSGVITVGSIFTGDSIDYSSLTTAFADKNAGSGNKTVTVGGSVSIDDGNTGGNYNVTLANNTTSTINTAALTVTAPTVTRNYDGTTTAAGVATASGLAAGDSVNAAATLNFDTKMAGTGKTVTASALTVKDGASANMTSNYSISYVADTASVIDRIALTLAPVSATKTYDGATNSAGAVTVTGLVSAYDTATVAQEYLLANALGANGSTLRIKSGYTILDGNSADMSGNYTITDTTTATGTINPRVVSLTGSRSYDGTTDVVAGIFTLGNLVTGETLTLSGTGTVLSKNVGTGTTVTPASLALSDSGSYLASNYTFTGGTHEADITAASLTLSTSDVTKTYSGNTTAAGTAAVTGSTLFSGDTLSGGSFAFTDPNAGSGNKTVTVSGITVNDGNGGANYTVSYASNTTSTINAKAVTLSATKTYDGSTTLGAGTVTLATGIGGEALTYSGATANSKNVADNATNYITAITLADGAGGLASNYILPTLNQANATVTINTRTVTLSASKTYNGNSTLGAGTVTVGTGVDAETLSYSGATVSNAHVATAGKYIDAITLGDASDGSGGLASNYALPALNLANAPATINARAVSLTGSRGYDGTADVAAGIFTLGNRVTGETLTLSGSGTVLSKNVGAGKTVTLGSLALGNGSGGLASDYTLTGGTYAADITVASLTLSISNVSKTYSGNTTAVGTATVTGGTLFSGDTLSGGSFAFTDPNAGSGNKTVTVSGITISDGNGGANYTVGYASNTTSTITPLSITVAASAASKVYGNADPALDYSLTSGALVSGDSLSGALSRVTGENVGSYAIQQGTLANSNYAITYAGAQLAITARPITVTAAAQTKVYGAADPTLTYTLEANSSGRGLVDGDSFTGTLARAAGTQVGSYAIGKSTLANGNYAITYTAADLVITPKTLTLAGSTSLSKTYDGSIAMPVGQNGYGSLLGIVGSDTLALAGAPVFSSKDAGTRAIQQGTLLLAGADAGNYTLSWTNGSGTINPAPLSVRANDAANFVTQGVTGTAAFNGLSYSGFVAGETSAVVSGTASITRTGTQTSAGTYSGALTATGLSASNYAISFMPGDYTIVPANQLLVEVQNTSNTYGSAAAYSITSAKYLAGDGVTIAHLTGGVSISGNSITINDGSSTASFTLVPSSGTTSTAGYLNVGSYQLAASGVTENSTNFGGTLTVVGAQSVTQKALTTAATGGLSKVYDGTTAMSGLVVGLGGLVSGDAVSATGNGAYAGRNAGSNLNYAVSALQLAGADAGNYYLAGGTSFTGSNGAITPKAITASYTALDKVYDGTTVATVSGGSSGFIASDVASLTYTTAAFADRNVGAGKTVTVSGVDLTGSDAANYSVSNPTVLTTASITAKTLTLAGANGLAKTYDGTVLMPVADTGYGSPAGIVSGDTVSVAGAPVYDGTAVGSHLLQQGTVGLAGADAGNYSLSWTDGTGAITQAVLTVRANNAANFITQSVTGTQVFNDVSYSGFVNGETSAALGGAASISRIGNQTLVGTYSSVLVPSGLTATNYSFNYVAGDYTIVPASQLLVVVQNTSNSYGSAPTYAVTSAQYLASDGSTIANLTSNVSVTGNTVTITDGGSTAGFTLAQSGGSNSTAGWLKAGSYQLAASGVAENSANFGSTITVLGSQTVTQKAITASYTATDKTYDGTTAATASGSSSGVVTNDLVSFAYGAASFADRHADTGKTVTISGIRLAGDDAANYTLSANTATTTANIDAASLTLSTSNVSKTYDRTTNAAGVAVVTAGTLYGGDSLAGGSFAFTDANAGSGNRTVLVSGVTVNDGNSGANYNVTYASNATSTITPKAITASFSANDKIYDGNATATVSGSSSGVIGGDTVSFSYTAAAFADANVGVGKTVSISGIGLGDAQSGNYSLAATSASTTASITARPITVTTDAKTKVYGAADPALTYQITVGSLIGGDTLSNALSRVAGGNVGSYAIQQGSLANSNYAITYVPAQFIISPVLLTLAGSSGLTKTYDGTALMPLGSSGYGGFSGVGVSGDILTLNGAPVFASADAGAQAIQQGTVALSGANAGNYSLAWTNGIGTISKAPLTVRANDDANFVTQVVAGTAVFNSVAYSGFVNGETSAVLGGAATITRSGTQTTAGTYNGVLLPAGLTAANYDISYVAGSYTIVPANQLLVTVGNAATSYGTAATYGVTGAKYLASDNTTIVDLTGNVSATGNAITINDGVYGAASFTLAPSGALYSTANLLRVGNYALGANNVVETHANFSNTLTIVGSHTVSQKAVTAAASGIGKVYDGTTAMNGVTMDLTGRAADDVVTVSGIGAFASKNAGSNVGYAISNILLGGADAGNYVLTGGTALSGSNGNIARRTLTLAWTGQDKLYDGTTVATVSATDDRIGGDVFALGATANFADPMPGTRKPVTIDGIGLSGVDAANYVLASATGAATATIQALPAIPQPSPSDPGAPGNPGGPGGTGGSDPFNPFDPFAPTDPGGTPTDPTGTPTDPTGTPTDPTGTPTDSTGTPTDPTGTPTDPKAGGPTGGPDTRPGVDGDIASSVALTLPGGVSINLSLPAGLSIEREPGTATVRFAPPGSENSGDNGTVISTTLSVIVLKGDRPPASVPGIAVTEVDGAITVSSFDGGANGALPSPGTVRNSLRIELKGGPGAGAASFSVDLTDSGIVIRPRDRLAQAMIDSLREDVIALALAETRRQFKVPLDRIKSVFIDQT